jgi:hypothetical protein
MKTLIKASGNPGAFLFCKEKLMQGRPDIPENLKRKVLIEAGHRCAIPTCRYQRVEIAHIKPWSEVREHKFENLIALCPNCHELYDKDKKISQKEMKIYKANLGILNSRYSDLENRILEAFIKEEDKLFIVVPAVFEILYSYLVQDGLFKIDATGADDIMIDGINLGICKLIITEEGRDFIKNMRDVKSLR